nr:hypothetical protein [Tanacetum cinerariifolium]
MDFQDSLDYKEGTRSSHKYLNELEEEYQARALLDKSKSKQIPTQKEKILGIDQLPEDTTSSRPNHDTVCSTPLPPLEKFAGAKPVSGPKTTKSILKSNSTFKAKTLKAPVGKLKNVKIEDDPPLATVMKELNKLKLQLSKNKLSYSRNHQSQQVLFGKKCKRTRRTCDYAEFMSFIKTTHPLTGQGESSSSSRLSRPVKPFPSCIHCGYNDHQSDDCVYYPIPDLNGNAINETQYKGMIGSLMYLTAGRPDIQFSSCLYARYQEILRNPTLLMSRKFLGFFSIPTGGIYGEVGVNTFKNAIGAHYLPHSSEYVALLSIDIVGQLFETIRYGETVPAKETLKKVFFLLSGDIIIKLNKKQREKVVPYTRFVSLLMMHKMKEGYGDGDVTPYPTQVFKAPLLIPRRFPKAQSLELNLDTRSIQLLQNNPLCPTETTKGMYSKAPTGLKIGHFKRNKDSSSTVESNPSQTSTSIHVVTEMHKEDQQATGSPNFPVVQIPQLKLILENPAPSDFIPQQQGMNKGTKSTSYDHLFVGLKKQVHELEIKLRGDLKEIPTKLEDFTKTVTNLTSQAAELKTLHLELPAEFLFVPNQVKTVQVKLKTLDALPSLFNKVTNALNQLAQAIASKKTNDASVPSACQAGTQLAEGEKNKNQTIIS